jgi:hypothetical protein
MEHAYRHFESVRPSNRESRSGQYKVRILCIFRGQDTVRSSLGISASNFGDLEGDRMTDR